MKEMNEVQSPSVGRSAGPEEPEREPIDIQTESKPNGKYYEAGMGYLTGVAAVKRLD